MKPKTEESVVKVTKPKAKPEEILKHALVKAECCVVHLCGCS